MIVLVTGATGRLGRAACDILAQTGFTVRATDQRYQHAFPHDLRLADLRDRLAIYPLLQGADAVVHLGNHPHLVHGLTPQQVYTDNVAMNVNVFEAARDVGVRRIVFASSIQTISGDREAGDNQTSCLNYLPIDGDMPAHPRNLYALSKVTGELMLRYYADLDPQLSATAVRFPFLLDAAMRYRRRRRLSAYPRPDEGFSYLDLRDAGRLLAAILTRQEPGYHQMLPAAATPFVDVPIPDIVREHFPNVPLRQPPEAMTGLVDNTPITRAIGWTPQETLPTDEADPAA